MNSEQVKNAFNKASHDYDQHSLVQFKVGCELIEKIKSLAASDALHHRQHLERKHLEHKHLEHKQVRKNLECQHSSNSSSEQTAPAIRRPTLVSPGLAHRWPSACRSDANSVFPQTILDLGCGTGKVTRELVKHFANSQVIAVDIAPNMLNLAQHNLRNHDVDFYLGNFDEIHLFPVTVCHSKLPLEAQALKSDHTEACLSGGAKNLLFSNMALHWSSNLNLLIPHCKALLNNQGMLAFTIPLSNTFHELQNHFAIHHFYDVDEIKTLLHHNDMRVIQASTAIHCLTFPNTLSTLQSIKKIGANQVVTRKTKGLRTRKWINQINIQSLTYRIGYFIAELQS